MEFKILAVRATSLTFALLTSALFSTAASAQPVGDTATRAQTVDGQYISWREHIIDDPKIAGFALSGSDGLVLADIDQDGFEDIISVHESDSSYDSAKHDPNFVPPAEGHVRIAFGSADPKQWHNITIAEGSDAPAPEDAATADFNGDGYPDVIVAAELSHLIYLQNPGKAARTQPWQRLILPMTKGKGSYIRVFTADLDGDGIPEAIAPNKGAQRPGPKDYKKSNPVSVYKVSGNPLEGNSWQEIDIGYYSVPQNSEPVDIDSDGDLDIIVGSRGEQRIVLFENTGQSELSLQEHAIGVVGALISGFNLEYADLNNDQRLDIVGATNNGIGWIEQPARINAAWVFHLIGNIAPDIPVGLELADINGDGLLDLFVGSYSYGDRENDSEVRINSPLGRIAWFENSGNPETPWARHDISRRQRGMYDKFVARDIDGDGDMDFIGTRGNSAPYDGVIWLEQVRSSKANAAFQAARKIDSPEVNLPE